MVVALRPFRLALPEKYPRSRPAKIHFYGNAVFLDLSEIHPARLADRRHQFDHHFPFFPHLAAAAF
jgi:hypothetical protein